MAVMALLVHGEQDAPPGGEVVPAEQLLQVGDAGDAL